MASNPSLQPEIGPDGIPREAPVISYTERIIEAEQLQLQNGIGAMYCIMPATPPAYCVTSDLEFTITTAKLLELTLRKIYVWESASKVVKDEEAIKQKLCEDLSNLVQESSTAQFSRLEELKRRLEALNPTRATTNDDGRSTAQGGSSVSNARESSGGSAESVPNQSNGQKVAVTGEPNQQTSNEGEGRSKKKVNFQMKGKGIGAVPKGRSSAPGWTGAGFDVDGRT
ncbi:hypothetical protein SESBI_12169 [Sesbania bispinosa]|nr:hypothetical protein SESBI_12169 [Sesbania bispinosa]